MKVVTATKMKEKIIKERIIERMVRK